MRYELRPRSFGEIIDGGFQLYRDHFWPFLAIAAAIEIPAYLFVDAIQFAVLGREVPRITGKFTAIRVFGTMMIQQPVLYLAYLLQAAALVVIVSDSLLGKPTSVAGALKRGSKPAAQLLGASVLLYCGTLLGALTCLIPGLVFLLHRALYVQAILIENRGALASLRRSKALVSKRRGQVAGLLMVVAVIQGAIMGGLSALVPKTPSALPLLRQLLSQLPSVLLAPLGPAVLTVAYFDARIRDEAFDLEVLADETLGASSQRSADTLRRSAF